MIGWKETVLRIALGALLGGLVGLEREMRGQSAGFRTHTLVAMGATLITLVSQFGFSDFTEGGSEGAVRIDPTRIASQIVVGIGFLGAGAIIRHGTSIKGLTTAASLWVVAAMGLAVGAGFYSGAVTVSLLLLLILRGFRPIENQLVKWAQPDEATLLIRINKKKINSQKIFAMLGQQQIRIREIDAESSGEIMVLRLGVRLARSVTADQIVENLSGEEGILEVSWER